MVPLTQKVIFLLIPDFAVLGHILQTCVIEMLGVTLYQKVIIYL